MKKKLNCVLLVDDNDSDNFIHKRVIKAAGITDFIGISLNGQEAIDFLKTKIEMGQQERSFPRPALIFLDINMPLMNGWEFLEEYQQLDDGQKGKAIIIMLTTSLKPTDVATAEKTLGRGCFLYKPLTLEMLDEIIQKHFQEYL
ncbi:MAG: response regulator [Bacteroidales bacterium]|jgi:CheY-like chemotaxis protein